MRRPNAQIRCAANKKALTYKKGVDAKGRGAMVFPTAR